MRTEQKVPLESMGFLSLQPAEVGTGYSAAKVAKKKKNINTPFKIICCTANMAGKCPKTGSHIQFYRSSHFFPLFKQQLIGGSVVAGSCSAVKCYSNLQNWIHFEDLKVFENIKCVYKIVQNEKLIKNKYTE